MARVIRTIVPLLLFAACAPADLRVATFNLRTSAWDESGSYGPWPERRALALALVDAIDADLWAFQEAAPDQRSDLAALLGATHETYPVGEQILAFRRSFRWEGARSILLGRADGPRVAVALELVDRRGAGLVFVGAHASGDEEELVRVRDFVLGYAVPAVLAGDFNGPAGTNPWGVPPALPVLTAGGGLRDAFSAPHEVRSSACWELGCAPDVDGARVDWILATPDHEPVHAETVQAWTEGGVPVSDHFPQVADLARGG